MTVISLYSHSYPHIKVKWPSFGTLWLFIVKTMKLFGLWILTFVDGCILQPQDTCFLFKSRYFIIIYFPFLLYLMLKPRIIRLVTFISEHMMLEKAGLSIIFLYFVFMLMYYHFYSIVLYCLMRVSYLNVSKEI